MYLTGKIEMGVYWEEIQTHEKMIAHWGELGRAMLRLKFVTGEMESSVKNLRDLKTIYRLQYQVENFYVRIFELRERLFSYVAALLGDEKIKDKLRKRTKRSKVYDSLTVVSKECVPHLKKIIDLLDDDINIRNVHTHSAFLRVVLHNDDFLLDIEDLWWEHEENTEFMERLYARMRKEGRIMENNYKVKVHSISMEIDLFLKSLLPYLRQSGA